MINKKHTYAVILAGGAGTRFWPMSRKNNPKQFLALVGKNSLLQQTIMRVKKKINPSNIFIVAGKLYKEALKKEVASFKIPNRNILLEPEARNTAPSILYAALTLLKKDKEATMVVLPSDHLIKKQTDFLKYLDEAIDLAQIRSLVTLGIIPTRPDTGYGYLKGHKVRRNGRAVVKVDRFVEKPNETKAKQYLKTKTYLWNSGMFIWRADVILEEFKKYLPQMHSLLSKHLGKRSWQKAWNKTKRTSIDYGILEKAKDVVTVPVGNIGWSDLGSWEALCESVSKDKAGNFFKGDVVSVKSKNSAVFSDKRVIATVGIENLVIVDTKDAILICKKSESQYVKDVVETLNKKKRKEI